MIQESRSGGNYGPDQLMDRRPDYTGPIEGLYMSGSPTHPGGSISGAPGYNCAGDVLDDLGVDRWWRTPPDRPLSAPPKTDPFAGSVLRIRSSPATIADHLPRSTEGFIAE